MRILLEKEDQNTTTIESNQKSKDIVEKASQCNSNRGRIIRIIDDNKSFVNSIFAYIACTSTSGRKCLHNQKIYQYSDLIARLSRIRVPNRVITKRSVGLNNEW